MHEHTRKTAMLDKVLEHIQYLGMEDGGDLKVLSGSSGASQDKDAGTNDGADP